MESGLSSVLFPTVIDFDDSTGAASERIKFGLHDDLQIYHDSNNSQVIHNGTGNLKVDSNNRTEVDATSGVDIQFNGATKLTSLTTGVGINGALSDSSGTMSGTLQFPIIGGKIATEGFGIALAVALG